MFGIGGGVLLVPLLGLLFAFGQHRAQGTSLVALIPPTGILAAARVFERRIRFMENRIAVDPRRIFWAYRRGGNGQMDPAAADAPIFAAIMFVLGACRRQRLVALRTA